MISPCPNVEKIDVRVGQPAQSWFSPQHWMCDRLTDSALPAGSASLYPVCASAQHSCAIYDLQSSIYIVGEQFPGEGCLWSVLAR